MEPCIFVFLNQIFVDVRGDSKNFGVITYDDGAGVLPFP